MGLLHRTPKERRKYRRLETRDVVSIAPAHLPDRLAVGRDVSVGGIRFEVVGCDIALGDVFRITFNVGGQTLAGVGRVVWATDVDALTLDVGVEFVEIDPAALRVLEEEAEGLASY